MVRQAEAVAEKLANSRGITRCVRHHPSAANRCLRRISISHNFLDQITERRYGESGFYLLEDARTRHIVTATGARLMEGLPRPGSNALIDRFVDGYDETGVTDSDGRMLLASARRVPAADWFYRRRATRGRSLRADHRHARLCCKPQWCSRCSPAG